ncbi:hypothetical protein E4U54_004390 [Claviceps lovelessii]|nr:hypothetical protein E4U54_004390 [Claviceps lovelessii]
MDGEFMSVRTWQGSIMVSTSLIPQSFDERTSFPNGGLRSNSHVSDDLPRSQHRSNAHMVMATPPPPAPPPVPDYWHHGTHAPAAAAAVGGGGDGGGGGGCGGNGFDFDGNLFYAPSSRYDSAVSGYMQPYSPVYTPRTDDDAASIPEAYPLFSPWDSVDAGISHHSSGHEWGDASFATDPGFIPAAECYYSAPVMNLPAPSGMLWTDDGNVQILRHEAPSLGQHPGLMQRPRTEYGPFV